MTGSSPKHNVTFSSGSLSNFLAIVAYNGAEYVRDLILHSYGYILLISESGFDLSKAVVA